MVQIQTKLYDGFNVELSFKMEGPSNLVVGELLEIAASVVKTLREITGVDTDTVMDAVIKVMNKASENTPVN